MKKFTVLTAILYLFLCSCGAPDTEPQPAETEDPADPVVSSSSPATPETLPSSEPDDIEPLAVISENGNKIENGDFSYGASGWGLYLEGGVAELTASARKLGIIQIKRVGTVAWGVQLTKDGISLTTGNKYRLSFDASSTVERHAIIRIQKNASPYTGYVEQEVKLMPETQTFSVEFEMLERSDPACRMVLNLGTRQTDGTKPEPEEHEVTVSNFELVLTEGEEGSYEYEGNKNIPLIHVNQLGYRTRDVKKAILVTTDDTFEVCDDSTDAVLFTGKASELINSAAAREKVRVADFSGFTNTGRFYIRNNEGQSYSFDIGDDPYQGVARAVLDMMHYQKCGVELDAGDWSHAACHTSDAVVFGTDQTKDVSGGWHDAGDYGRYVAPAAKAVCDFLLAYELSGNPDPDIPDIVRFELDWMLKMQDTASGGVYHKVSAEKFCGVIMPDEETETLYLSPISATATGGFAAVLARASRVYRASDPVYADRLLAASKAAWEWLIANPQYPSFKNPEGITTGEYPDTSSLDERMWAACELYGATKEKVYHDYIESSVMYSGLGWAATGYYASIAYLLLPEADTDASQRERMLGSIINACKRVMEAYAKDPYMVSLEESYVWGSNMTVANNAMTLLIGNLLSPDPVYVEAATQHVHYLLGRNALSQSYITGFGMRATENPHHRPSEVVGKAVPGMVAGGPDGSLEDPFVATMLKGLPPAKCYADSDQSYSTNEVTIYWNSPVYFVMAMLGIS